MGRYQNMPALGCGCWWDGGVAVVLVCACIYLTGRVVDLARELKSELTDPVAGLACGTENGPFELGGTRIIDRAQLLGGATIYKKGNEYYLFRPEGDVLLGVGREIDWVDGAHEISVTVLSNEVGKGIEVNWEAHCGKER